MLVTTVLDPGRNLNMISSIMLSSQFSILTWLAGNDQMMMSYDEMKPAHYLTMPVDTVGPPSGPDRLYGRRIAKNGRSNPGLCRSAALEGQVRTMWAIYGTNLPRQQCSPDDVVGRQSTNLLHCASSAPHYSQRRSTIFCSQCRPTNAHIHESSTKGQQHGTGRIQ